MVNPNMLFSRRMELANEAEDWCRRSHIKPDPFNVITALSAMDYTIMTIDEILESRNHYVEISKLIDKLPDIKTHPEDVIKWALPPRKPQYVDGSDKCEEVQRVVKFCKSISGEQWIYIGYDGEC